MKQYFLYDYGRIERRFSDNCAIIAVALAIGHLQPSPAGIKTACYISINMTHYRVILRSTVTSSLAQQLAVM